MAAGSNDVSELPRDPLEEFVPNDMKIDDLDFAIIELLQADPRMTNRKIADECGAAEATVANRIKDLERRNVLRIIMRRDVYSLGFDLLILMDISVQNRSVEEVATNLEAIEEAASVSLLLSDPEIVLQLNVRDRQHLLEVIDNKVAPIAGISHWTLDTTLEILKLDTRYATLGTQW